MNDAPGASAHSSPQARDLSSAETTAREDDLQVGLTAVSELVTGALPLKTLLEQVALSSVRAIPNADAAGVSLLREPTSGAAPELWVQTLGASDDLAARIDEIQYELVDEGPCITAVQSAQTVTTGSIGGDARWPRFGPRLGRLGVHSVLSLPLTLPDSTSVGALNMYSRARNAFDADAARIGELFAAPAGVAVHNAGVLDRAQHQAEHLRTALVSRATIDQAIGILRSRSGSTADEAFDRLRTISQAENIKLAAVAGRIVEEAVRRARARHADT